MHRRLLIFLLVGCFLITSVLASNTQTDILRVTSYYRNLSAGSSNTTIDLTPAVNVSSTFVLCSNEINTANPVDYLMRYNLTNSTGVFISRGSTAGTMRITCFVAEFSRGVVVQHGRKRQDAGLNAVPITAVNQTSSFVIWSNENTGTGLGNDDFTSFRVRDSTNLEEANKQGTLRFAEWQVIDMKTLRVQNTSLDFRTALDNFTTNYTETNKTFSVVGFTTTMATVNSNLGGLISYMYNNTMARLARGNWTTLSTLNATVQVVEFMGDERVQSGIVYFNNSDMSQNVTISSVNVSRAIAFTGGAYRYGKTNYTVDDSAGPLLYRFNITSATQLQITRSGNQNTSEVPWNVVEFTTNTCTCPTSGNWNIDDGSICVLNTVCDINNNVTRINNGGLRIMSGGQLRTRGLYVDGARGRLYVDTTAGLYCKG